MLENTAERNMEGQCQKRGLSQKNNGKNNFDKMY